MCTLFLIVSWLSLFISEDERFSVAFLSTTPQLCAGLARRHFRSFVFGLGFF
jgi:hypothetical protein